MTRASMVFSPFRMWHYNGAEVSERILFNEADVMDYIRRKCPPAEFEQGVEEIPVSLSEFKVICGKQVFRITPALDVRDEFLVERGNLKFRTLKVIYPLDGVSIVGWITVASKRTVNDELGVQFAYCLAKVDAFHRKKGQFYAYLKLQKAPIRMTLFKGLYERIKTIAVECANDDQVYWMKNVTAKMLV
jgi:hypothetical protein